MVVNKKVNATQLDADLTDIADAIREKSGTSATLEFPEDFVTAIDAIPSGGGAAIADGIVVKARDTNGYPTEVDLYAADGIIQPYQFMIANQNNTVVSQLYRYMQTLHVKNAITQVKEFAFAGFPAVLSDIDFPSLTMIGNCAFTGARVIDDVVLNDSVTFGNSPFTNSQIKTFECGASTFPNNVLASCKSLVTVRMPKLRRFGRYVSTYFNKCTALQNCVLGGIGYSVDDWGTDNFKNCTQTGLIITAYTIGDKVDSLLATMRSGATNATIIIKAASATTYNGTSYAAGDTILTSEVTS